MENQTVQTLLYYNAGNQLSDPANHDVNGGQFKDWRVPNKRELNLLYNVYKDETNAPNLEQACYWSSTEGGDTSAWYKCFFNDNGNYNGSRCDTCEYKLRAVRAF